jgi:hypothetical protein
MRKALGMKVEEEKKVEEPKGAEMKDLQTEVKKEVEEAKKEEPEEAEEAEEPKKAEKAKEPEKAEKAKEPEKAEEPKGDDKKEGSGLFKLSNLLIHPNHITLKGGKYKLNNKGKQHAKLLMKVFKTIPRRVGHIIGLSFLNKFAKDNAKGGKLKRKQRVKKQKVNKIRKEKVNKINHNYDMWFI